MKLKMIKDLTDNDIDKLMKEIIEKHDTPHKLKLRTSRTGCRNPNMVDEYMIYKALDEGADYRETKVLTSVESISSMTPKRVELINYLTKNEPGSINELAEGLGRDYKNVYDDIRSLNENGIVELNKEGKSRRPVVNLDKLIIDFT
ncbi:MAG: hypothetical protein ACQESD_04310 [Thermoplasmatota archaeon]